MYTETHTKTKTDAAEGYKILKNLNKYITKCINIYIITLFSHLLWALSSAIVVSM